MMGPYNYDKQVDRAKSIEALLKNKRLSKETREMWTRILNRIAFSEDDYNARVMYVYRNHSKDIIKNV